MLKNINFFPIKTRIRTIHGILKLDTIDEKTNHLFVKFLKAKSEQELIAIEIHKYKQTTFNSNMNHYKAQIELFQEIKQ